MFQVGQMQTIRSGYQGLSLLVDLNWDRLLYLATLVGALMAASTGIVGATVVTMGLLSLPTMLRRGYLPSLACGSIAASGTLGQIIPPSIVLVLLGDQISNAYVDAQRSIGNWSPEPVSVGDLFAGALMVFVLCLGFFVTPAVLGGGKVIMVSMKIVSNIELFVNWGAASALGVVLLLMTIAVLWVASRFVRLEQMTGGGN